MKKCFFLFLVFLASCSKEEAPQETESFYTLMGLNQEIGHHIKTEQDYRNLYWFEELYQRNHRAENSQLTAEKSPKVLHFIWLGPKPFPEVSIKNIQSWVMHHPQWKVKLWSDRRRALPHEKMELCLVSDFTFTQLKDCFDDSNNYAEKSDVLRYEILYQKGGLYVDHDVECFRSFDPLQDNFDLYCGLEPPHAPILNSSVSVCNNLIGARVNHPVLGQTIEFIKERWEEIGKGYPEQDKESIIYRIVQRTFSPFEEAIKLSVDQEENRDIVFPAAYFNQMKELPTMYAHHQYMTTWFPGEDPFQVKVRETFDKICRKSNQILLFNGVLLFLNLLLILLVLVRRVRIRV